MVTGHRNKRISATAGVVGLAWVLMGAVSPLAAQTTSAVITAGLLIFPKILVHTTSPSANPALDPMNEFAQDTVIQLTNTSDNAVDVDCYYVNANSHCGGANQGTNSTVCTDDSDCRPGVRCVPGWQSADFHLTLTPRQPIGWVASQGLSALPCSLGNGPCVGASGIIPAVAEEPFIGELRCVQVIENEGPVAENDLKGEATIVEAMPGTPEVLSAAYNAIGFFATEEGDGADLCLGGPTPGFTDCGAEYTPCMASLSLQHFFDGAEVTAGTFVNTELTLSPCSAALEVGDLVVPDTRVAVQILVYNEFEQRFSTGHVVSCVKTVRLVDIDTPLGPAGDVTSLFSVGVQGTLGGQTRLKGSAPDGGPYGPGLVALAHQYFSDAAGATTTSSAYHVNGVDAADADTDAIYPPAP